MIIDDYVTELARLRARYGVNEKLALLYQVGSFFELYASNEDEMVALGEVAGLMNVVLTRKNKAVAAISRGNPGLVGFPVGALPKYLPVLVGADFTVAIVRQVGAVNVRELTEIVSPATWTDENAGDAEGRGTRLACLWIERATGWTRVGVAAVDLTTGEGTFGEADDTDDAMRLLRALRPRETVVVEAPHGKQMKEMNHKNHMNHMNHTLGGGIGLVHASWTPPAEMTRLAYQEAILGRAFPSEVRGLLSPIEHVGLERMPSAMAAYATVLEFAYAHDERIVARLRQPTPLVAEGAVVVAQADQLNITGPPGKGSLLAMLNVCKTAFGRRAFANRLLHPTSNVVEIDRRLDLVAAMVESGQHQAVRQALVGVQDMERLARRVALGRALPHEFAALADSGSRATGATNAFGATGRLLMRAFEGWDLEALRRGDLGTSAVDANDKEAAVFATERLAAATEVAEIVRLTEAKDDGTELSITVRRFAAAAGKVAGLESRPGAGGTLRLFHPAIAARERASVALTGRNREALVRLGAIVSESEVAQDVINLVHATAELDITAAIAHAATHHHYCRPTLLKEGRASIQVRALRHPIVERLLTDEPFTPNDVALGTQQGFQGTQGTQGRGILVYGLNMVGKTTLSKAIGLAAVMAQAGMYVAADELILRPFDAIFTRIAGGDDLYAGQSSFAVEMTELRTILRRATTDSLILGDELCCTTESVSGTAIVAQGIATFVERGCCFVLATHLHAITSTKRVASLVADGFVRVAHLHVETETDGTLVYHRTLREGQGQATYGIEVARALGLGDEFMTGADAVRREITGVPEHMVAPRPSRYNARVFVDTCFVCGEVANEVHHLKEQATADADGFVAGGHHMNKAFNLVAICEKCHRVQHQNTIGGTTVIKKTSKGRRIAAK